MKRSALPLVWGRVRSGAAVADADLETGVAKLVRAVAAAVIGEQGAHDDAVTSEELEGLLEEGDGGVGFWSGSIWVKARRE